MKLVNQLYHHYKDQLVGDEEDAAIIVSGILESLAKDDLLAMIQELEREELYEMLGRYMVDQLREMMTQEGVGKHDGWPASEEGDLH